MALKYEQCEGCGEPKATTAFPFIGRSWVQNGTRERSKYCRVCTKARNAARYREKVKVVKPQTHGEWLREQISVGPARRGGE